MLIDSIIICITIQSEYLEFKKPWPRIMTQTVNGNFMPHNLEMSDRALVTVNI